jgi:hypothetical protein
MWRLLHELVAYLEREGLAVINALDRHNVEVFRGAAEAYERVEALIERAAQDSGLELDGDVGGDDRVAVWQLFETPPGSWLERRLNPLGLEGWPELSIWAEEPLDEPAVTAGYTLPPSLHHSLSTNDELASKASQLGLEIREWDSQARIVRIDTLTHLIEESDSLSGQATRVASFAREAFAAAEALDPGDLEVPPTRPSRRSPS